jgi:hypothetical protein
MSKGQPVGLGFGFGKQHHFQSGVANGTSEDIFAKKARRKKATMMDDKRLEDIYKVCPVAKTTCFECPFKDCRVSYKF